MDLLEMMNGDSNTTASFQRELMLFKACSNGKVEAVDSLIDEGISPTFLVNGFCALHIASKKKFLTIVAKILEKKPSIVDHPTEDGRTAMMIAAYEGHIDMLILISKFQTSDVNKICDNMGNNCLHYSCWGGHTDCVKYLVEFHNMDASIRNKEGMLPVQYACAGNHVEIITYLSQVCKNFETVSESGLNSLHRAVMYGAVDTIRLLIQDHNMDVTSRTGNNSTILHLATQNNRMSVIKLLVEEFDSDVNAANEYGLHPLHLACLGYSFFMHISHIDIYNQVV